MKLVDKLVHAIDGRYTQMPTLDEVPERSAAKAGGAPQMADFAPPQKAATAPPPACCGAAMSPETSEDVSLDVVEGGGALEVGGAEGEGAPAGDTKLVRMGLMTALAIAIHNFPEVRRDERRGTRRARGTQQRDGRSDLARASRGHHATVSQREEGSTHPPSLSLSLAPETRRSAMIGSRANDRGPSRPPRI